MLRLLIFAILSSFHVILPACFTMASLALVLRVWWWLSTFGNLACAIIVWWHLRQSKIQKNGGWTMMAEAFGNLAQTKPALKQLCACGVPMAGYATVDNGMVIMVACYMTSWEILGFQKLLKSTWGIKGAMLTCPPQSCPQTLLFSSSPTWILRWRCCNLELIWK